MQQSLEQFCSEFEVPKMRQRMIRSCLVEFVGASLKVKSTVTVVDGNAKPKKVAGDPHWWLPEEGETATDKVVINGEWYDIVHSGSKDDIVVGAEWLKSMFKTTFSDNAESE